MSVSLDGHLSIFGLTNTGKSHMAKWLMQGSRRYCVAINAQGEDWPGTEVREAPSMQQIVQDRRVVWTPRDAHHIERDLPGLVDRLFAFGERVGAPNANRAAPRMNLFCDEAHLYAPKNSRPGPLERVWTQGLRYGVVGIAVSQRPALLSHTVLTQSRGVALFRCTEPERDYLERNLAPMTTQDWSWLQRRYHWLSTDGGPWTQCAPVPAR